MGEEEEKYGLNQDALTACMKLSNNKYLEDKTTFISYHY